MNDWQQMVVEELKAINRKMERIEDNIDGDLKSLEQRVHHLENKIEQDIAPIRSHIAKVKIVATILSFGLSALIAKLLKLF